MQFIKHLLESFIFPRFNAINKYDWAFIIIFIAAALVRCYEITLPYCKIWESGFQEVIAKNHYYYGFQQTHFLSVFSVIDGENLYHLSHQPILQILIAFSYTLFGVHEWSARLVPIVFSLGSIIILYLIVQLLFNQESALLTSIFASFMPMSAYYGRIVNFEAVVLFFVLFVVWSYIQWDNTNKKKYYHFAIVGIILGGLVDWPFFLILPFLLGTSLLTGKKIRSTIFLFILGCSIAGGYIYYRSLIAGPGWGLGDLLARITYRSHLSSTIFNEAFFTVVSNRLWNDFTVVLLFLSILGLIQSLSGKKSLKGLLSKPLDNTLLIPFSLLLFGLSYIILFPQSTIIHTWQMYYLIPGTSIYAAIGLYTIIHYDRGRRYTVAGCKILAATLLILFLAISANALIEYHQHKYWNAQKIGLLIESHSAPDDPIYFVQIANPTIYYANRTNCWNTQTVARIEDIEKYHPLYIGYIESVTIDSVWNRSVFTEYLYEQQYFPFQAFDGIKVWAKNVDSIPLLYRERQSIELYDFLSHKKVERKKDDIWHYIKINEDGKIILFQHPSTEGIVVMNYAVTIPANASLTFGAALDEKMWEKSDGVTFEIFLNASEKRSLLFSRYIDPKTNISDREWHEYTIPLHEYAGKEVIIGFAISPGPNRDANYDWAYWINPEIMEQQ